VLKLAGESSACAEYRTAVPVWMRSPRIKVREKNKPKTDL
jgi:hypothetical protein